MRQNRFLNARVLSALVFLLILTYKLVLLWTLREPLKQQALANPGWVSWQFMNREALREHFLLSQLLLQQTPPIPNILYGIVVNFCATPYREAFCLISIEALLGAITGTLLFWSIARHSTPLFALFPTVLFAGSVDLISLEYNSLGQTFYEFLAALILICIPVIFESVTRKNEKTAYVLIGLVAACGALTRATLSFIYLPLIPFIFLKSSNSPGKRIFWLFLPVLFLHGGWALKNAIVYKDIAVSTSSWKGTNLVVGLTRAGLTEEVQRSILQNQSKQPEWFNRMIQEKGVVHWHPPAYEQYVPNEVRDVDAKNNELLGGNNNSENSSGQRLLGAIYSGVFLRFALENPWIVIKRITASYEMFWQPIRNYAWQFLGLIAAPRSAEHPFLLWDYMKSLFGPPDATKLQTGYFLDRKYSDGNLLVLDRTSLVWAFLCLIVFHFSVLKQVGTFSLQRLKTSEKDFLLTVATVLTAYVALLSSIAEYGENMRFRTAVEPLIILVVSLEMYAFSRSCFTYLQNVYLNYLTKNHHRVGLDSEKNS